MAVAVYIGSKTHLLQLLMRFACNANIQAGTTIELHRNGDDKSDAGSVAKRTSG